MTKAKVGIVIATYNSERTLRECLNSIACQSLRDIDVYVQDGGSKDGTLDILKEYDFLRYSSEEDSGVYNAWNKALLHINAEWLIFLGSDDYLNGSTALASVVSHLDFAKENFIKVVYGKNKLIDGSGQFLSEVGIPWDRASVDLQRRMTIRHPGCFHHFSLFDQFGDFDESYKVIGDYNFILRVLNKERAAFYPFSIVSHRVGGLSNKPSLMLSIVKENFRLRKELDLSPVFLVDVIFLKRLTLYLLSVILGNVGVMKLLSIYSWLKKR